VRKPIFLDRDGVLNRDITPYVTTVDAFEIFPWTVHALSILDQAGYDIFVVSNQQGVGKGLLQIAELEKMNEKLQSQLRPLGFEIKKFYYCFALDSENDPWRKPGCGMLTAAGEEFGFDTQGCFMIGDKDTDLIAGAAAGCRPLLVLSGVTSADEIDRLEVKPEAVFPTLLEAAEHVTKKS
jgi:D-glycero-D-manno-heptose 1,7-bisphosphate phosphatase